MTALRFRSSLTLSSLTLLVIGWACSPSVTGPSDKGGGDGDGDGDLLGDGDGDSSGDGDVCVGICGDGDFGDLGVTMGVCGDGKLTEDEACDDGNELDGDGCSKDCAFVEVGFLCREAGSACRPFAKCGDGQRTFPEQCDDGNSDSDDGCSERCKIEIGFKCEGEPSSCVATECGDYNVEGAELCDDGNDLPFDGCSPDCQLEPVCTVDGGCTSTCGDGLVLGDEECDDANQVDEDGCSADCKIEDGYECPKEPCDEIDGTCVLRLPTFFRDFPSSHPDMGFYPGNNTTGRDTGMVAPLLDAEGKPVPAMTGQVTGLADWYRDNQGGNTGSVLKDIVLFDDGEGNYVNRYLDDGTRWEVPQGAPSCQPPENMNMDCPVDGNPLFFPLDDMENPADPEVYDAEVPQEFYGGFNLANNVFPDHNFHFTTEVTYWFVYEPAADAQLTFIGDDDVWVFLNGHLAVDIGNLHPPRGGRIRLGAMNATVGYAEDQAGEIWDETTRPISDFGLTAGEAYEIKVFHAERSTLASSFQLTLAGFDTSRSDCKPTCGDGFIGFGEECDDGVNAGGYNACGEGCVLGGYCGDGIVQEEYEACDDRDPNRPEDCAGCRVVVVR